MNSIPKERRGYIDSAQGIRIPIGTLGKDGLYSLVFPHGPIVRRDRKFGVIAVASIRGSSIIPLEERDKLWCDKMGIAHIQNISG